MLIGGPCLLNGWLLYNQRSFLRFLLLHFQINFFLFFYFLNFRLFFFLLFGRIVFFDAYCFVLVLDLDWLDGFYIHIFNLVLCFLFLLYDLVTSLDLFLVIILLSFIFFNFLALVLMKLFPLILVLRILIIRSWHRHCFKWFIFFLLRFNIFRFILNLFTLIRIYNLSIRLQTTTTWHALITWAPSISLIMISLRHLLQPINLFTEAPTIKVRLHFKWVHLVFIINWIINYMLLYLWIFIGVREI